jgi:hypothetical protein
LSYDALVDGDPARVGCNLSYFDPETRSQGSGALFTLGANLDAPNAAGLAAPLEEAAIERARNALAESLLAFRVSLVGTVVSKGSWQAYFYGSETLEEGLIPAAQAPLRAEGWSEWTQAESDPSWRHYLSFLLPPTADRIRSLSQRSTDSLTSTGHNLAQPRTLTHTLIFPSPEAAELSLSSIIALDFERSAPLRTINASCTKADVSRADPPDHAESTALMLSELCAPYDGDHLRWTATDASRTNEKPPAQ